MSAKTKDRQPGSREVELYDLRVLFKKAILIPGRHDDIYRYQHKDAPEIVLKDYTIIKTNEFRKLQRAATQKKRTH